MVKQLLIALLIPLTAFAGTSGDVGSLSPSLLGVANGIATLDGTGKVPASQIPGGGGGSTVWGAITGTLSSQTDLQTALNGKQASLTVGGSSQYLRADLTNQTLDTSVVPENGNLYYTAARFNAAFGAKTTDNLTEGSTNLYYTNARASAAAPVQSVFGRTGVVAAAINDYNTAQVTESTNLYYTQARFDAAFAAKSTTNLTEGTNLYYTNARASAAAPVQSVFGRTGAVVSGSSDYVTTQVAEGTNLYFTNARAQAAVSATLPVVDTAGVFSLNNFTGDTGTSAGLAGGVPAPAQYSAELGQVLGAGGSFITPDAQKLNNAPFNYLTQSLGISGNQKMLYPLMIQHGGNTYAIVGGGTSKTVSIYNVTDQAAPVARGSVTIAGTYGACGSNASWPYVFVPASGGRTLTVLNITDPNNPTTTATYSWAANTTSVYSCAYANGLVFMAGQSHGLGILDVGNGVSGGTISAPVLAFDEGTLNGVGQICNAANSCKSFGVNVDAANQIVYVSNYSTATPWTYRQLKAYSYASSITSPTLLQNLTLPANTKANGIALDLVKHTAYVTDTNQNVYDVVDITNVSTGGMTNLSTIPLQASRITNSQFMALPSLTSNLVYVPGLSQSVNGGIDIYDLSNRSSPVYVSSVLTPGAPSVAGGIAFDPRGGYIYMADYGNGTTGSALDIFSAPYETATVGSLTVNNLTVKGTLTAPAVAATTNTVTANTTIPTLTKNYIIDVNTTSGALAITLPDAVASQGFCVYGKNIGSPANNATYGTTSAQTVDTQSTFVQNTLNDANEFCAINGNWSVF